MKRSVASDGLVSSRLGYEIIISMKTDAKALIETSGQVNQLVKHFFQVPGSVYSFNRM